MVLVAASARGRESSVQATTISSPSFVAGRRATSSGGADNFG